MLPLGSLPAIPLFRKNRDWETLGYVLSGCTDSVVILHVPQVLLLAGKQTTEVLPLCQYRFHVCLQKKVVSTGHSDKWALFSLRSAMDGWMHLNNVYRRVIISYECFTVINQFGNSDLL